MDRYPTGRTRQLIRCHRILDRLSSSRIGYNASQLAKELGYTTKTIYRDLWALRDAGVQIQYQARFKRYQIVKNRLVEGHLGEVSHHPIERDSGVEELRVGLREAGRYLGVSPQVLKELLRRQEIPIPRNGGRMQLRVGDLVNYKRLRELDTPQLREETNNGQPDAEGVTRRGLPLPTSAA